MGFVDALKKVGHEIKVVAEHIAAGFVTLFGKEVATNFAKASIDLLKTAAGQVAAEVVSELEQQAIDGLTKRSIAFGKIADVLKQQGLSASTSEINLLIEIAVTALKQHFLPASN